MAQSNQTSDSSIVESFTSLLIRLSTKEFASERLPHHSLIRKQIESLIQSPEDLQSLSTTLHKEMMPIISSLPSQKSRKHSFQVELWPLFHAFRVREVPRIWKDAQQAIPDVDSILTLKATMEYALVLLQKKYGDNQSSMIEQKEKRRETISLEEENSIRYVAGFVVMKMKKKYSNTKSVFINQSLLSMEEGTAKDEGGSGEEDESFMSYTRAWLDLVNRGGLFRVHDDVYSFFLELELCMYPLLRNRLDVGDSSQSKSEMVKSIRTDEDVLFAWSVVTIDLSEDDSQLLLADIIELWMTIRGFSIASRLLEDYKEASKLTLK